MKGSRKQKHSREDPSNPAEGERSEVVQIPQVLPVLPAKDMVAFPSVVMSVYVARPSSRAAVESAIKSHRLVFIVSQQKPEVEQPTARDLFQIGVVGQIVRTLELADGRLKVLLQGLVRGRAHSYHDNGTFLEVTHEPLQTIVPAKLKPNEIALMKKLREALQILVTHEQIPEELLLVTEEVQDPGVLADVLLAHYQVDLSRAQAAIEEIDGVNRLKMAANIVADEVHQFKLAEQIEERTRSELSKGQREYYLREQMKQIQRELGDTEGNPQEDLVQLKQALTDAKLPAEAQQEAQKQLKRLERMSSESSDHSLIRTYLEWLSDLPWSKRSADKLNVKSAKKILDEDHYGLDKIKDRIVEYLSVRQLNPDTKGPILCFVGPPGVGKTSLAKSIARSLGRGFHRMALGGMRDEAEIRGHRRTYVGAMPGRVIQGLKQAGTKNPVFVLDELDKLGADFRGDPSSALLEVLDPHQNHDFRDHYLGVPFDLSEILFIATANTPDNIPEPLLDRLEVIYLSGYTTEEKLEISKRFLIPRQLKENGLAGKKIQIDDEALLFVIERYTREAGVRNLEREIGSLLRKLAREVAEGKKLRSKLNSASVEELLGTTKFDPEDQDRRELIGMARGLAWTQHGGEVMPVEVSVAKGTGQLHLTGQLGSVMQESAQAALFFTRAHAAELGVDPEFHAKHDVHIHVPSGATPKDGPSAGITITSALVSALSGRKVRSDIAMTGEITLRGTVLPIGGLKEKALAALRFGIRKLVIPRDNLKDISEIPDAQRKKLTFIPVQSISEVVNVVLQPAALVKGLAKKPKRKRAVGTA